MSCLRHVLFDVRSVFVFVVFSMNLLQVLPCSSEGCAYLVVSKGNPSAFWLQLLVEIVRIGYCCLRDGIVVNSHLVFSGTLLALYSFTRGVHLF